MSRISTNNVSLRYVVESSIGVAPTSGWRQLEPNSIGAYGAVLETKARRPISPKRGRRKGAVVNLTSPVDFEGDLTMDSFEDFIEGFMFAEATNIEFDLRSGSVAPPVATSTTFTISAASALLAGKVQWVTGAQATLLWASGYLLAGNNGLHALTVDLAGSGTTLTVGGSSMTAETPPANASLQVCGIRAAIADLVFTVTGSTATLASTDIDFTTIGVKAGQMIHIGSPDTSGVVQNGLGTGTDNYGYARVTNVTAGTLTLDKLSATLATDPSNATVTDIMFGKFIRNVTVGADADDTRYIERSYSFEQQYPNGESVGVDTYEYARGNFANQLDLSLPLGDLATASWGFVGTTSEAVTTSRDTGPSTALEPLRTTAIGTASDIMSITTDVVSSASDVCFKDLTVSILNNMTTENCLGVLGASFVNAGAFEVNVEGQMLFTKKEITNAIRNNTTVTMGLVLRNNNGAVAIDFPTMTFGGGNKEFPVDQSVLVNITGQTFTDPTLGHDAGISLFAAVPYSS